MKATIENPLFRNEDYSQAQEYIIKTIDVDDHFDFFISSFRVHAPYTDAICKEFRKRNMQFKGVKPIAIEYLQLGVETFSDFMFKVLNVLTANGTQIVKRIHIRKFRAIMSCLEHFHLLQSWIKESKTLWLIGLQVLQKKQRYRICYY